jgi:cytochrome c-type biogenesis protein CcmH
MTVFWSLAAVMVMVALLFILPPLLRNRELSAVSRDELNTEVIKTQLAELDTDLAAGKLDEAQYGAARTDLEQELLYDLATTGPARREPRSGRWATLLIIPALPLCAVLLYQLLGSVELIDLLQQAQTSQPQPAQSQQAQLTQQAASIEEMVNKLAARLQQQPDDLKGWVMLARSYNIMKRYSDAEAAYENVLSLGGESADLLTDYADAMVMANGGTFTDKAGALLTRALELDPGNVKGLWLAGHWKNQSGAYAEAVRYWQLAAAKLPAGSEDAAVIAQQISRLQEKAGIEAEPAPAMVTATADTGATAAADSDSGTTLSVHVTLAPELAAKAAAGDTVFVFARATEGPRMPLAIVRKQVSDLPLTVTLDDSQAMMPAMKLSNFEQVVVGARISKSGNAMPQSGDLQGSVSPVATRTTETVQVTIGSSVP